jgi:hypothetical protein
MMRRVRGMRATRGRVLAGCALVVSLSLAPRAHADPTAEDRAAADALFREGRALVKQGKYAEACPKLAASQTLDPISGTLLALGDCYELNGQTASAWATFNDAQAMARRAGDRPRAKEAARRADLLEQRLSKLVVEVDPEQRALGLEVRRNGRPLEAALLGSAIPVDPGEHLIEVQAPGKKPWSTTVRVEPKPGQSTVRVPALADAPAPAPPAPAARAKEPAARPVVPAPADAGASSWSAQRTVGLVLGGLGLGGIAVGSVFGVQTLSKISEAREQHGCTNDDPPRCDAEGVALHKDANTTANVSNAAFAAGGALLVAGVVVFLTAPSGKPSPKEALRVRLGPVVSVGTAGLLLQGSF